MAVRSFDLSEPQATRLRGLEAPARRRDVRRMKQRYAMVGIVALTLPFAAALVLLGAAR